MRCTVLRLRTISPPCSGTPEAVFPVEPFMKWVPLCVRVQAGRWCVVIPLTTSYVGNQAGALEGKGVFEASARSRQARPLLQAKLRAWIRSRRDDPDSQKCCQLSADSHQLR